VQSKGNHPNVYIITGAVKGISEVNITQEECLRK